ncbi:hypothetical protein WR25_00606 isoform C [Diploscapter pachys]|uniref:BUB1 N-terminal domain-containing protein n=1 Tax=Diploscapter pachys TaxID=2018661 RepID=A0A2A2KIE3_9BILA|nr:hypothetical protein WR25_00606 isoform C [Diploscapter pachys]
MASSEDFESDVVRASDETRDDDNVPDWERYSENLIPNRRGRQAGAILKTKGLGTSQSSMESEADKKLDETMDECQTSEDPLDLCLQFCKWFENRFQNINQRLYYKLLWRIVEKYSLDSRYLEDERMLKIWSRLADNSLGHGYEIYQHAVSHGSLVRCAQIYVQWSLEYELRDAVNEARKVLHRGIRSGATPISVLQDAIDELEVREARRQMEKLQNDSWEVADMEIDDLQGEHRLPFTRLPVMDDGHSAPIVRLPSIMTDHSASKYQQCSANKSQRPVINNDAATFEVYCDEEQSEENYLKNIHKYTLDTRIERFAINKPNPDKESIKNKKIRRLANPPAEFYVWTDESEQKEVREEEQKVTRQRFGVRKAVRDQSMEVGLLIFNTILQD